MFKKSIMAKSRKSYPIILKLRAIHLSRIKGFSKRAIALSLKVPHSCVIRWCRDANELKKTVGKRLRRNKMRTKKGPLSTA